jgi:ABC-type tungstate transport system substrate-binding protein
VIKVVVVGLRVFTTCSLGISRSGPLGHVGSVLLSVVAQALLCNSLCACFFLPFLSSVDAVDGHRWEVHALNAGFRTEPLSQV